MRIKNRSTRAALMALALSAATAVPAAAAQTQDPVPVTVTGGDTSGLQPTFTADQITRLNQKKDLAAAWYAKKMGTGKSGQYEGLADAYAKRWGAKAAGQQSGAQASAMTAAAATATTTTNKLPVVQVDENPSYYCGPASGYSVLDWLGDLKGDHSSAYDGTYPLTQKALAGGKYMQTDANGATNWDSDRYRVALNRWADGDATYGFYMTQHDPSTTLKSVLVSDIDNVHPFGADTVEFYNGPHYNHHPNRVQAIGHWIAAYGYTNSGSTIWFADSSPSVFGSTVADYFSASTNSFADTYLKTNGIVW